MRQVLLSIEDSRASLGGLGRTKLFELIATGELPSVKIGRRRMIPAVALEEYAQRLSGGVSRGPRTGAA